MLFPPSRSRSEFAPSRFSLVSTVYENAQRATKQAADFAQSNLSALNESRIGGDRSG